MPPRRGRILPFPSGISAVPSPSSYFDGNPGTDPSFREPAAASWSRFTEILHKQAQS